MGSRVACGSKSMWAQVLREKHLKNESILKYDTKPGNSSTWKGIIRSFKIIEGGFGWKIGNGRDVSIWFDVWIGNDPICLLIDEIDPTEVLWNVADIIHIY